MPRIVRAGVIQAGIGTEAPQQLDRLKKYMIDKHVPLIEQRRPKVWKCCAFRNYFTALTFAPSRTLVGTPWRSVSPMARRSV